MASVAIRGPPSFKEAIDHLGTRQAKDYAIFMAVKRGVTSEPNHIRCSEIIKNEGWKYATDPRAHPMTMEEQRLRGVSDILTAHMIDSQCVYSIAEALSRRSGDKLAVQIVCEASGHYETAALLEIQMNGNTRKAEALRELARLLPRR